MRTTWKVTNVHANEATTRATLVRGQWFIRNAVYDELLADESYDGDMPDEFIDLDAPEEGAEWFEMGEGSLDIDITDGLALRPGDSVAMTLNVLDRVPT